MADTIRVYPAAPVSRRKMYCACFSTHLSPPRRIDSKSRGPTVREGVYPLDCALPHGRATAPKSPHIKQQHKQINPKKRHEVPVKRYRPGAVLNSRPGNFIFLWRARSQ